MNRFEQKVAIVTGAGGGIGRAIALQLASEGASILAVDLSLESMNDTVSAVEALGGQIHPHAADVSDLVQTDKYVQAAVDVFGGVDVLINNAGIHGTVASLVDYPEDVFDSVLAVNVKGVWLGMRSAAPVMSERGGGSIVNTASVAGLKATAGLIAYGASKHAVVGMTKTAARELAASNIRVNAVCPAPIETDMMRSIESDAIPQDPNSFKERVSSNIPLARYGEAEEVASLMAFLASTEASYITGGIYPIDGGQTT